MQKQEHHARKSSGNYEEETKGTEGSQISDEYHLPAGADYARIVEREESADFGPPIFQRVMQNVTETKEIKKPVHPAAKAYIESMSKLTVSQLKKCIKEEDQIRFKFMSYSLLSDAFFDEHADHLAKDDPCRDASYRRRRVLAEIEASKSDIICL